MPMRSLRPRMEVMGFVQELLAQAPSLSLSALAEQVRLRFKLQVHSRSIERALLRQEKKRP